VKAFPRVTTADNLGQVGLWHFTREYVVEPELTFVFYQLYEAAFAPLRVRSMARQALNEAEFTAQMTNGEVLKYVAWDDAGNPVGMCALTRQLESVPWISPDYFAHRYPQHWARNAVWYLNFVLAHPSQRHARFIDQLMEVGIGELIDQGAVCAYDMCAYNDEVLGLGRRLTQRFERTSGATPQLVDTQNYYEVRFS
jgi:hypothetical protein